MRHVTGPRWNPGQPVELGQRSGRGLDGFHHGDTEGTETHGGQQGLCGCAVHPQLSSVSLRALRVSVVKPKLSLEQVSARVRVELEQRTLAEPFKGSRAPGVAERLGTQPGLAAASSRATAVSAP